MQEIASVYARALFQAAREGERVDVVREELGQFADALAGSDDLRLFFFSPYFSTAEKRDPRCACLGEVKSCFGADACAASCY